MARIAGVNIPTNKRVVISLTYIHGIGPAKARKICEKCNISLESRVQDLTEQEVFSVREIIDRDHVVEGDLRRDRGIRHRKGLPVRGQRTHTNARSRKGPARPIAGKKNV